MKSSEIKELTTAEVAERIQIETEKYTRLRLNHAVSPLDNPKQIAEAKKDIARLKTELRARQITENK